MGVEAAKRTEALTIIRGRLGGRNIENDVERHRLMFERAQGAGRFLKLVQKGCWCARMHRRRSRGRMI